MEDKKRTCPNCETPVGLMDEHCEMCGQILGLECPRCDHFLPVWSKFCLFCGRPVFHLWDSDDDTLERTRQESKLVKLDVELLRNRLAKATIEKKKTRWVGPLLSMMLEFVVLVAVMIGIAFLVVELFEGTLRSIYQHWPIRSTITIAIGALFFITPPLLVVSRHWRKYQAKCQREEFDLMHLRLRLAHAEEDLHELEKTEKKKNVEVQD